MPIPSVTGYSNLVHHHLPNTAFAIVEEVYQRLPELMNLRDMMYALDKHPDFYTNIFKSTNYYGISFNHDYLVALGYDPRNIKDMQILATHIMGDSSYTRFYYKDTVEVPNQDGTVNYLVYTFLLPKIRNISKFTVYSKDRTTSREITVSTNNVYVVDADNVIGLDLTTEQSFAEILPAVNSTITTGGSGGSSEGGSSTPVELPDNVVTYTPWDTDDPNWSNNSVSWGSLTEMYLYEDSPPSVISANETGYTISFTEPYESSTPKSYTLPSKPVGFVPGYTGELYLTYGNTILLNIADLVTTGNFANTLYNYTSNFLTSSDLPDMSGYVQTSEVANAANKIPRFNSQGHLVLPDGTEIWREE